VSESLEKELAKVKVTPDHMEAILALRKREIPDKYISEHPGKGQQKFRYLKHTHATEVMLDSGLIFDYHVDIGNAIWFEEDHSAAVPCTLTVKLEVIDEENPANNKTIEKSVTETGFFQDGTSRKTMPRAAVITAAGSRGLPRCMMRMFGFGLDLYPEHSTPPKGWWAAFVGYAREYGVQIDAFREEIKTRGYTEDDLRPKFDEIMAILREMAE